MDCACVPGNPYCRCTERRLEFEPELQRHILLTGKPAPLPADLITQIPEPISDQRVLQRSTTTLTGEQNVQPQPCIEPSALLPGIRTTIQRVNVGCFQKDYTGCCTRDVADLYATIRGWCAGNVWLGPFAFGSPDNACCFPSNLLTVPEWIKQNCIDSALPAGRPQPAPQPSPVGGTVGEQTVQIHYTEPDLAQPGEPLPSFQAGQTLDLGNNTLELPPAYQPPIEPNFITQTPFD